MWMPRRESDMIDASKCMITTLSLAEQNGGCDWNFYQLSIYVTVLDYRYNLTTKTIIVHCWFQRSNVYSVNMLKWLIRYDNICVFSRIDIGIRLPNSRTILDLELWFFICDHLPIEGIVNIRISSALPGRRLATVSAVYLWRYFLFRIRNTAP